MMLVVVREKKGGENCLVVVVLLCLLCCLGHSFFFGVLAIEVGDKFWGMFQMLHRFPGAVACGETFPFD